VIKLKGQRTQFEVLSLIFYYERFGRVCLFQVFTVKGEK